MRDDVPTLDEYLGSSGYATAGFVGRADAGSERRLIVEAPGG